MYCAKNYVILSQINGKGITMNKKRILVLLIAIMMMAVTAVAQSEDDPAVIRVGDQEILKAEAQAYFDEIYSQYMLQAMMYGNSLTQSDIESIRDYVVEYMLQEMILDVKVTEYGVGDITAEDEAQLREETEVYYEETLAEIAAMYGMTVDEARAALEAQGETLDYVYEMQLQYLPYNRLYDEVVADVEVTDEEIEEAYASTVESNKESLEGNIGTFELYYNGFMDSQVYYIPEGYRYVKMIQLALPEDIAAEMLDFETDMSAVQNDILTLENELTAAQSPDEEAAADEAEAAETEPPRAEEEIQADIDAKQAEYEQLQAKYEELKEQILPSLKPTLDEIQAKLDEGEQFDDLAAEYSIDDGSATYPDGYMVHADSILWGANSWDYALRDAAMALENIGDISDPQVSDVGVFLYQYAGDVQSGAVELTDEVREAIRESLLTGKQQEAFEEVYDSWRVELNVETHPELIDMPSVEATEEAPVDESTGENTDATTENPEGEGEAEDNTEDEADTVG